jgi:microcin C transport system substrate-binding protein
MKATIARRTFLRAALALLLPRAAISALLMFSARAAGAWKHGLSLFGDLKYPPGFARFDYVEPTAPKGGSVCLGAVGTYDNFNMVVAGLKGNLAAGIDLVYDTLMLSSMDEPASEYGLLAQAVSIAKDASVRYRLRTEARWHDGRALTAEDVVFSFYAFKKNNPQLSAYYRHVTRADITGESEVTFTFDAPGNREYQREHFALAAVKQERFIAGDEEMIVGESSGRCRLRYEDREAVHS